jgi:hypothetical protein
MKLLRTKFAKWRQLEKLLLKMKCVKSKEGRKKNKLNLYYKDIKINNYNSIVIDIVYICNII